MDSGLKQRLIGAAVLISLAVLFLPAVLDGRKNQQFESDFIPPKPQNQKLRKLAFELQKNTSQKTQNKPRLKKGDKEEKTPRKASSHVALENAFIIQVASFSDLVNAKQLVNKLKSEGYKAFVGREKVKRKGKLLTRVLIGPIINKQEAQQVLAKIKQQHNLKATLVVFDPGKH